MTTYSYRQSHNHVAIQSASRRQKYSSSWSIETANLQYSSKLRSSSTFTAIRIADHFFDLAL